MVLRLPELGARLLSRIPRLEPVARIVLYQGKHFDGSGFPDDRVAGQDIPIGSRILKVLDDLARLEIQGMPKHKALEEMNRRKGCYDPDVLAAAYKCFDVSVPKRLRSRPWTYLCSLSPSSRVGLCSRMCRPRMASSLSRQTRL